MANQIPAALIKSLSKLDHFDPESFLNVHESGKQQVSVHMNPEKTVLTNGSWAKEIQDAPFEISGKVAWAPDAYYLSSRPSFTLDPLFHAGAYYVQEASGMFVAFALKQITDLTRKINVLDLCAAPGGKSTLIQTLISQESLLLSNEVIKTRVPVLHQNMTKWGRSNGIISNNDPAHFRQLPGFFDLLIIDAPCSGSGLFRKDPEAASVWTPELVKLCNHRQQRILGDAWDSLKEEGFLIYSTCSYSKEENEDILDVILQQYSCESVRLFPDPAWHIVETVSDQTRANGYRFYPDKVQGEGFYLAVIQKKSSVPLTVSKDYVRRSNKLNRNPGKISKSAGQQYSSWIKNTSHHYIPVGDAIHAVPRSLMNDFEILKDTLYLKKAGVRIGKAGENDWIPDHELALSNILSDEVPCLDIGKEDALHFLRGEPFETAVREKGWRVACFQGKRMGWVKLLDKRMNNYYPKSWRIRS